MRVNTFYARLTTGLLIGLLFSVVVTPIVIAATPDDGRRERESITLSPTNRIYKMDAGSSRTDKLTIVNDGLVDYTFTVYVAPYSVSGDDYDADFSTIRTNTDIETWVRFEKTSYFAKSGETVTVPYTFTVPANATPGGHYGVIFAETQPTGKLDATGVERKKRVGAIIYATVNGEYKMGGKVLILDVPSFQFTSPLKGSATVENSGNADFTTKTSLFVTDLFGNKKYQSEKSYQLLPQTSRKMSLEWPNSPGFGLFKVTAGVQFLDTTETKSSYVLIAPVWSYLVLVIAVLGTVIYFVQRRR